MEEKEVKIAHRILLDLLLEFHEFCNENNLKYYIIGGTLLGAARHKGFIPWDVDADVAMPRKDYERMVELALSGFSAEYYIQNVISDNCFYTPKTKILVLGAKKNNPNRYVINSKTGLNLDIFPLDKAPTSFRHRKIQRIKLLILKKILIYKIKESNKSRTFKGKLKKYLRTAVRIALKPFSETRIINYTTKIMKMYNESNSDLICSMASHYDYNKQVMGKNIYGEGKEIEFEGHMLIGPDKVHEYLVQIYGDYMKLPSEDSRKKMYENLELELSDEIEKKYKVR